MIAETPAEGILKTHDWGNSRWYKVVCGCAQPDHSIDFEVEADATAVTVNTYVTVKTDYWSHIVAPRYDIDNPWHQQWDWFWKSVVNALATRVKLTWTIWTKGYVKAESTITMTEQQALNYANTLLQARDSVKEFRDQH